MSDVVSFPAATPDRGAVLTKAVVRAADRLGLTGARLASVIGVSAPTVSRMSKGAWTLEEGSKSFELAALFVRLFRSLDAIAGGDPKVVKAWMKGENTVLGQAPIDMISTVGGLVRVVGYLDSRRAPL